MGKSGFKSLAEQLADLDDPTPKDFDPEDLDTGHQGSDDESESEVDENAGREHYQDVGKSKLRKPETVSLGKEYSGSRVSRQALETVSDDDDPFGHPQFDDDEDISSDDSVDVDSQSDEDVQDFEEDNLEDGRAMEDDSDMQQGSEDEDSDNSSDDSSMSNEEPTIRTNGTGTDDREELRRLMAADQKSVAATISQAAKADATKGLAVKQQRLAFDALLNARIKLQKGLTAVNGISNHLVEEGGFDDNAIKSAESAALALWSTLEELRFALSYNQSKDESKKRKRPSPVSSTTSCESLWQRMQDLEADAQVHRRTVLEKWNHKVRGTNTSLPNARGKLLGNSDKQSITVVLDAHVTSETGDRISKKPRTNNVSDEPEQPIYDDTVFYQSLLRELVEQRMSSSEAVTNGLDSLHLQLPTHHASGMRKDKIRKDVDTKASKGRKMRYNIHEKLQNFMAPEDRGSWTDHARDEFFASLLGKSASGLLGESDGEDDANGVDRTISDDEGLEEGGLRLFRG
ncbi:putative vesicle-mediated transport protein Bfr2/Che-1 [Talaromyces proteolyticus]|uniref:Protein BFR2 n=1 Tax=Talaromyces proteolyticus TaxID=1131652 RepID=A0AAD4L3W3_9EURO|nr:putative vesicle-mediated transport protein Bfr2/Che-1 [Talaromyces proteolyticus]KAH8703092.1 putative vesicle-mediated transport protein Bfr2/Che-1 [Talaromyces proteolyticus]